MSTQVSTDAIKRKSICLPSWSEAGHGIQGIGVGVVIGKILSDVHLNMNTVAVIFFCLITIGGFIVNFNRKT